MDFQSLIFYFFASLALFASAGVIFARNPVHSVLFLVLTFFASAGLWLLLQAEFLALILVLVYVGAVMTLFLFVVMMLNLETRSIKKEILSHLPFTMILISLTLGAILFGIYSQHFDSSPILTSANHVHPENYSNIASLGSVLYTDYFLPFQIAAVLLLVAIIAAIMLTHRPSKQKTQVVTKQIQVKREERVRLVSMKTEPVAQEFKKS